VPNTSFYLKQEEPNKSCLLAMRGLLLTFNDGITEVKKYGMPCFCYKTKAFCYIWIDKLSNEPYFLFVEGNKLIHKTLVSGNRPRMKILKVNPRQDLPIDIIHEIFEEALKLYLNNDSDKK
jgi:hypothetical protein